MTTGSGTGTPVTGASAITLTTLRARIRDQVENAWGTPDPLPVDTSSETLTTLRDRVETMLQDSTNAIWATGDIDEAIEKALEEYNRHSPVLTIDTHTVTAAGREQDISGSVSNLLRVVKVWWPYDSSAPSWPGNWVQFDMYPGTILYIDEPSEPQVGDVIRLWHTTPAILNGLNNATSTTIPTDDLTYLLNGAVHYAIKERAIEITEQVTVDDDVVDRYNDLAKEHGKAFRYGIRKQPPAWQRRAYGYRNDDIDEAVRWALGRFNEIAPQETIDTITLSSASREIDMSSDFTDLLHVTRVWWPYDSADPVYKPNWVSWEQWANILFIKSGSEPASGDVVRVWYERLCVINGLDGASTTTLPDDAETLLVTGAVGYVAEERIMEEPATRWRVPRALREWAAARLKDFERGLKKYAQRKGSRHGGLHELPALDRWDHTNADNRW